MASDNILGFEITSGGEFSDNVLSANRAQGLVVAASGLEILEVRYNAILGNRGDGIRLFGGNVTLTENNIFGNGGIDRNCGLLNLSRVPVMAPNNFWGAATGPGPDPADAVCDDVGSTTIVDPVATKAFKIGVRVGR